MPDGKPLAEVSARQFQWMIRYPGRDGLLRTADDLHTLNDLRFVKGKPVLASPLPSDSCTHGATAFNEWYKDGTRSRTVLSTLSLPELTAARGNYRFEDTTFEGAISLGEDVRSVHFVGSEGELPESDVERDIVVEFGGTTITPGDFLYADADGVIVAPRALHT
jgi:hypothetical protein